MQHRFKCRAKLTTGQYLTLEAGSLELQGQLVAGRDLTLKAQHTIDIRDSVTAPFVAQAERNLTVQGNQSIDILVFNHPKAALQSGGNLNLISNGNISGNTHFLSGGDITVSTNKGDISLDGSLISLVFSYYGISRNGGNITVSTTNGSLSNRSSLISFSTSLRNSGNGANITLSTTNGNLSNQGIVYSFSSAQENSGNGGDIILSTTNGNLSNQSNLYSLSYSVTGNSGNGGDIAFKAQNGDILGNGSSLYTFSGPQGTARNSGPVSLEAQNQLSALTSNTAEGGTVSIVGQGDLAIADLVIQTSKPVTLNTGVTGSITIPSDRTGRSGDVRISSIGNLTLTNSRIQSDTKGSDSLGNITFTSSGLVTLNQSQILSSTISTGTARNIGIHTGDFSLLNGSSINSSTSASG